VDRIHRLLTAPAVLVLAACSVESAPSPSTAPAPAPAGPAAGPAPAAAPADAPETTIQLSVTGMT